MNNNGQVSTAWLISRAISSLHLLKTVKNEKNIELQEEIRTAIDELENIRRYFDAVNEPELIDYAIYREKAAITRLSYLLRKARNSGIIKDINYMNSI